MPILMFLFGAAAIALYASHASAKPKALAPSAPPPSPYTLDPHLDPRLRVQVEAALANETDPWRLEAFANDLAPRYPYAAWYLRTKAAGMRKMGYGVPAAPSLPAPPAPSGPGLDPNLPDNLRFNVTELLTQGTDPTMLEAFAGQLVAYPLAASALRLKATYLRSMAAGRPVGAAPQGSVASGQGGTFFPQLPGFDPNMSPEIAMLVATALTSENDPAKLRALGNALMPILPVAATMLLGKANTLSPPAPASPPVVAPPVIFAPPPPAPPAPPAPPVLSLPSAPPPSMPGLFDAGMTPEDQARVVTALTSENDPAKLRALADAFSSRFPHSATMLTTKAGAIEAMRWASAPPPAPPAPWTPPPFAPPAAPPVIAEPAPPTPWTPPVIAPPVPPAPEAAPPPFVFPPPPPEFVPPAPPPMSVRSYRVQPNDFPIKIAKKFGQPEKAWRELVDANAHKPKAPDGNFKQLLPGEDLNIPASWPSLPSQPSTPSAKKPAAAPPAPVVPNPPATPWMPFPEGLQPLDPGIPLQTAQAVMTALGMETDATKLRGFASSILASYPVAAAVLLAKANTLGAPAPTVTPAALPAVHPQASTPTGAPSNVAAGTYRVERGDSPSRIAKKLTGNDRRWPELVAANASKAKAPDGNFKSLQPGEVLKLPASWASPAQPNGALVQALRA